jgi:hypothetical protein
LGTGCSSICSIGCTRSTVCIWPPNSRCRKPVLPSTN